MTQCRACSNSAPVGSTGHSLCIAFPMMDPDELELSCFGMCPFFERRAAR